MFQPKFQILLQKENFHDKFICLGSQLIEIINFIKKILPSHVWYVADINALGENSIVYSSFLSEIGSDEALSKLSSQINQFLSGVFFAIAKNVINLKIEQLKIGTEDEQFRSLPLEGVLIEIRAFDTSFFEIYTEDKKIIEALAQKFNIPNINNIKSNLPY